MVCSQTHEAHDGEPDGDDLGDCFAGGGGEKNSEADKPIAKDAFQEDLMPLWDYTFGFREGQCFFFVGACLEGSTVWVGLVSKLVCRKGCGEGNGLGAGTYIL